MPRLLGLLLALPVLEIVAFALVASMIGVGKAILLQVAFSAIGIAMLGSLITEARTELKRGGRLTTLALDGSRGMRGLAGLLFAVPGFITDAIAVAALVPEFRGRIRRLFAGPQVPAEARPRAAARPAGDAMVDLDAREWREVEPARRPGA
ncbi:FxsA family protein [Methylopila turkensis]|uniref:Exclusion protein FxsA n=1 Tax=Methylopila turkensis TaxID=1437816 RepID=A0A9W6JSE0_9HYPH|nr:FxsA family protein [Methylopila turkensis]GLK81573.1 exclusion protein FxsA [Methylopila turkensis]